MVDAASNSRLRRVLRDLFWVLLGVVLSAAVSMTIVWYKDRRIRNREPEAILDQADTERRRLTEGELAAAVVDYKSVLGLIETNRSLDHATKQRLKVRALSGISRTYSDWATLRHWRGLSRRDNPEIAKHYAEQALAIAPNEAQARVAEAYAYEAFGEPSALNNDSADSAAVPEKLTAKDKVNKLVPQGINNLDSRYLAWLASKKTNSFPSELRPEEVSDVRILVDVGLHFAKRAEKQSEKRMDIDAGEHCLAFAAHFGPNNPVVLFTKGYLSAAKENLAEAQDYYEEALRQEPEFPRARNNLGFTYAAKRDYLNAQNQFDAAAQTVGAPAASVRTWLYNLASASLEVGDYERACDSWKKASAIPEQNNDPREFLGLAMCDYTKGNKISAIANFRLAVKANKQPIDVSWFKERRAGPKELEIANALIQMAK
jgi:tetratricopeptide (TPR) repeat protein